MTGSDIAPNFDRLPLLAQAQELSVRTHADLKVLQASRHLLKMDREHVDKALERQELLLEKLNKMAGAGATTQPKEHAKPAPVPSKPRHREPCYGCIIDCSTLEVCPR